MLVGDPSDIPFQFQYLLDIEYAVGRVAFDTPEQYRHYAESVVEYERADTVPNSREVVYFGVRHDDDLATEMSRSVVLLTGSINECGRSCVAFRASDCVL